MVGPLSYCDATKKTKLLVDASPVGLVLFYHKEVNLLTVKVEFCQTWETEREMLAVVWGAQHFHFYTFAEQFSIVTDHKPLIGIFKSQQPTSARIECCRIRLVPYQYNLVHKSGKDDANPAD